jgi:hypothetical protein
MPSPSENEWTFINTTMASTDNTISTPAAEPASEVAINTKPTMYAIPALIQTSPTKSNILVVALVVAPSPVATSLPPLPHPPAAATALQSSSPPPTSSLKSPFTMARRTYPTPPAAAST